MIKSQTKDVCLICQDSDEKVLILHKTRRQIHSMCYSCLINYISDPIEKLVELAKTGNGSYTGKTTVNDVKGKEIFQCAQCDVVIDRDVSGARNIFIKNSRLR